MSDKEVTFTTLGEALAFVEERGRLLQEGANGFRNSFKELTGFEPDHRVSALDVMKICHTLYGEPKK